MSDFLSTISSLAEQLEDAWHLAPSVRFPASYRQLDNVVVVAMGGSGLGTHLVQSALAKRITVPITVVNDYHLPACVSSSTLVILCSFSGTTEEVLGAYKEARRGKHKMFVVTSGGVLAKLAKRDNLPMYLFDPRDLAPQPRYGTAYLAVGTLVALRQIGGLTIGQKEMDGVVRHLHSGLRRWTSEAKKMAAALTNRAVIVVASEHLEGAAHVFNNQINESAKHFSARFAIPELNHHLMEGLTFPKSVIKQMTFLFVESALYHPRVMKRYELTKTVVKKNGAKVLTIRVAAGLSLAEAFELIQRGALVTAMMAERLGVDPTAIPWVDWFKQKME